MQSLIDKRIMDLSLYKSTDSLAYEVTKSILGPSIEFNKKFIPFHEAYMYQVMDLGSQMNKSLRKNSMTPFIYNIYEIFCTWFDRSNSLDKSAIVFRGIPSECLGVVQIGDILYDAAFNSVSLDPRQAIFFGNALLLIKLKQGDKLVYINGCDNFYSDVFECVLPAGTSYKVVEILTIDIHGLKTCYVVEIIDTTLPIPQINDMDKHYTLFIEPVIAALRQNETLQLCDQIALVAEDNIYWYLHEVGHPEDYDKLYQEIVNHTKFCSIIETVYLYLRFLDGKKGSLHARKDLLLSWLM